MRFRQSSGAAGAGSRDKWVTIQSRPDDSESDTGFPVDGPWTDLAQVAMTREDLEADEIERTAQQIAISTTRWEMPYRIDMDPERVDVPKLRRLLYYGRTYDIVSAIPIGRARAIALVTEAHAKTPTETTA